MAKTLPVLILKSVIILPNQTLKIEPSTHISIDTIQLAEDDFQSEIIVVSPKDLLEENLTVEDLPNMAILAKIVKKITLPSGNIRITLEGKKRVKISKYFNAKQNEDILECQYLNVHIPNIDEKENLFYQKELKKLLKRFVKYSPNASNDIISQIDSLSLDSLTDSLSGYLPISKERKTKYLETISPLERAKDLIDDFVYEFQCMELEQKIQESVSKGLEKNEKDYILREKVRELQKELGEENQKKLEIEEYCEKLEVLDLSYSVRKKIEKEIKKYEFLNESSPDISFVRNYLDLFFSLPWNEETIECEDLKNIEKILNKSHFGLKNIKTRILEYAAMKKRNPLLQAPILCLVGPPGVGKSTIAASIANALHRKFSKISVGGLNDSAELTGHRRTYLGSAPGRIITALQKCGSKNPVILIDEVDKMVKDYKGDPASVLLDILDPNLNQTFIDQYLEEPFDLSHVLFLLTANKIEDIPIELLDRLEVIEISSYSTLEKINLAKDYILPSLRLDFHVEPYELQMDEEALEYLILNYTDEAGVRDLRRKLEEVYRKSILNSVKNKENLVEKIEIKDIKKLLEEKITIADLNPKVLKTGLVKTLAMTSFGGLVIPLESVMFDGSGLVHFTGSLGDVLKESIEVSISFIKVNAKTFGISSSLFDKKDLHLHLLDGSLPKDGPSAGIAITTSFISLFTNKKVPLDVAMTGEITLRGEILPVGGIKEKIIGAYNRGIKKIYLPEVNKVEVKNISKKITSAIEIVYVKEYMDLYKDLWK